MISTAWLTGLIEVGTGVLVLTALAGDKRALVAVPLLFAGLVTVMLAILWTSESRGGRAS